ncbi:MAG TPA: polysaccharide biosynthesis protein [Clostridiales bacterium]|mgnify:FL=1|nr:polysaccharide biosynthesis protein [Clostridiales bacterium]
MATHRTENQFLLQGSILAVASLIVRIIGLIYRIPMTRIIGDEGMGLYTIAYELYSIALILSSYSLPLAVSKLVASKSIIKEHRNTYRIFVCAMLFAFVVGMVSFLILLFGADFFATVLNNDPNVVLPIKVLAPTLFVFSIMGVFRGFYQGKNTMIPTAISQVIEQIINAVVSIVAAYFLIMNYSASANVAAYGAAGGTFGTLIGAVAGLLFLLFVYVVYKPVLRRQIRNDRTTYLESYKDIFKMLIATISPIILSQTVYHISGVIDNAMFGNIMATKEVTFFDNTVFKNTVPGSLYSTENVRVLLGIYGNKYRNLSNVPVAIASAIGAAIVTSITAAKARGMDGVIRYKAHVAIKFNMIIAIPSAVGMGVLAYPILNMLFPGSSQLDANYLMLGSIAIVFYSLSTVTTAILQGINKLRTPVINAAISLGFHVVLVFFLLKFTSLSGYSLVIGNVTFALVISILNWISIEKYLDYKQEILKTFVIPTVSSVIMGVATYFIHKGLHRWTGSNTFATIVSLIAAIIIYFTLLVLMKGATEDELEDLPKGESIIRFLYWAHILKK